MGAMNTHRGIVNRLLWMQDVFHLDRSDAVLQKTPCTFDGSVWEFFWPLITGAHLVLAQPEGHFDSAYLAQLIQREQVTTIHFAPSMLEVFLDEPDLERQCHTLRRVICSGEALSRQLQERFFDRLGCELHNLYGPAEASATWWPCSGDDRRPFAPIGRPIANTEIYLLDGHRNLVPVGVPGELHIGGVGLARGYLNRPELTAEKFIETQLGRLYRTGDLARRLADGVIEYLGRINHEVTLPSVVGGSQGG
jgi:non-ribosomal peptide synthetase component F